MMSNYTKLNSQQPVLVDCFFAFNNEQYKEGIEKNNLQDKKIYRADGGLFGTKEGIQKLYDDYEAISKQISETCNPQEVYDYEFNNHECSYVGNDEEAIKLTVSYFGEERAKGVKRRYAVSKIEDLQFN